MLVAAGRACDLHILELEARNAEQVEYPVQTFLVAVFHIQVDLGRMIEDAVFQLGKIQLRQQDDDRAAQAALVKAAADRKADDCSRPQAGRGGQPLDALLPCDYDRARADEADAGDDLRAEARHVGVVVHVQVQELAGHGGHRSAEADQDMRAEARRAALVRALQPDQAAAEHGEQHAHSDREHGDIPQPVKNR